MPNCHPYAHYVRTVITQREEGKRPMEEWEITMEPEYHENEDQIKELESRIAEAEERCRQARKEKRRLEEELSRITLKGINLCEKWYKLDCARIINLDEQRQSE